MKEKIEQLIVGYVADYPGEEGTKTNWKAPLVAYADADDPLFSELKEVVSPSHALPEDFLPEPRTVIAYFIPFQESVAESNIEGKKASREWAVAYVETNRLIHDLNSYIGEEVDKLGYRSTIIPATHNFDEERLISDWSHKHVAYVAGLGKFGLHNMLITEKGCAGRVGTIVTDLPAEPTAGSEGENCLYRADGSCTQCVQRCVNGSLEEQSYDRESCYSMCLSNEKLHSDLELADVCGKCAVGVPCSFTAPVG